MPLTLANASPIWLAGALYSARTSGPAIASSGRANVASGGVVSVSAAFVPLDVDFTKTPFSFLRMKFLTALNVQRTALHGLGGLGSCSDLARLPSCFAKARQRFQGLPAQHPIAAPSHVLPFVRILG